MVRTLPVDSESGPPFLVSLAVNADSLPTWFLDALAGLGERLAAVTFDRDDDLQEGSLRRCSGRSGTMATHYVPTSADFARPIMLEFGWGCCRSNSASRRLRRACSWNWPRGIRLMCRCIRSGGTWCHPCSMPCRPRCATVCRPRSGQLKKATRSRSLQMAFVAPTGVDPVTFRFSVIQRRISHSIYMGDILLIRHFSGCSQLLAVGFRAGNGPEMAQDRCDAPAVSSRRANPGTRFCRISRHE